MTASTRHNPGTVVPYTRLLNYSAASLLLLHNNNDNNNNNSHDNVYAAVIMAKVIARVHPVHLMNVD